jgi:hypothetical protein
METLQKLEQKTTEKEPSAEGKKCNTPERWSPEPRKGTIAWFFIGAFKAF